MTKQLTILTFALTICLTSCGQTNTSNKNKEQQTNTVLIDTSVIAILPYDTTQYWVFKDSKPTELTSDDLLKIETILIKCINDYNPDTEKKVSMLVDSLTGSWELIRTVRYENGDTIIQKPSTQIWVTPGAKPFTTIKIDSLKNFEVEQACMKCPYLFWKGQYEVEIRTFNGLGLFYLNFIDTRQKTIKNKKRKKAFTLEFNGHITNFENGELTLTDKERTEWIYKRQ